MNDLYGGDDRDLRPVLDPFEQKLCDWVDERLAPAERVRFEAELAADPALAERARRYRATVERVRGGLAELEPPAGLVDAVIGRIHGEGAAARRPRWPIYGSLAAAAVVVLSLLATWKMSRGDLAAPAQTPAAERTHTARLDAGATTEGGAAGERPGVDALARYAEKSQVGNEDPPPAEMELGWTRHREAAEQKPREMPADKEQRKAVDRSEQGFGIVIPPDTEQMDAPARVNLLAQLQNAPDDALVLYLVPATGESARGRADFVAPAGPGGKLGVDDELLTRRLRTEIERQQQLGRLAPQPAGEAAKPGFAAAAPRAGGAAGQELPAALLSAARVRIEEIPPLPPAPASQTAAGEPLRDHAEEREADDRTAAKRVPAAPAPPIQDRTFRVRGPATEVENFIVELGLRAPQLGRRIEVTRLADARLGDEVRNKAKKDGGARGAVAAATEQEVEILIVLRGEAK